MASFLDAATAALRRSYCAATDRLGVYAELYLGSQNPVGQAGLEAANFLHNAACDRPPPVAEPPPFTGGQCAFLYNVKVRARYSGTFVPNGTLTTFQAFGQVRGVTFNNVAGNTSQIIIQGGNPAGSASGTQAVGSIPTSFSPSDVLQSVAIEEVTPVSGSNLDNCGNPPGVRPPYTPGDNIVNDNITYVNNEGDTVNIPVVIALGYAQVNLNGELNIPFTLNAPITPVLNISGTLNLNTGGINFNGGNPALPSSECNPSGDGYSNGDDVPPSTDPSDPDVPDPDPGEQPPQYRRQIRGAWVVTTTLPPGVTRIFQDGNPDVFAPDLGLVSFKIAVAGISGWTEDIRIKNTRQFVPCPWEGGAVEVKGTPRTGGEFIVSPVSVKVTDQQTFPD